MQHCVHKVNTSGLEQSSLLPSSAQGPVQSGLGIHVGAWVGAAVGKAVGAEVGKRVGCPVGAQVIAQHTAAHVSMQLLTPPQQ